MVVATQREASSYAFDRSPRRTWSGRAIFEMVEHLSMAEITAKTGHPPNLALTGTSARMDDLAMGGG